MTDELFPTEASEPDRLTKARGRYDAATVAMRLDQQDDNELGVIPEDILREHWEAKAELDAAEAADIQRRMGKL